MSRTDKHPPDMIEVAKPAFRPTAEEWAAGEGGRKVLERVIASAEVSAPWARRAASATASGRPRSQVTARLAFAAGGLVLVVLIVALALLLARENADHSPVAGGSDSTTASAGGGAASEPVSKLAAVENVIPLYWPLTTFESVATSPPGSARPVNLAVAAGLLTPAEIMDGSAAKPMTQGQYALLLIKAFGPVLRDAAASEPPIDPQAADEREAIQYLAAAGIILPGDGEFRVDEILTQETESRLLTRIEGAIEAVTAR